jgi:hypothetical protein
MHDMKVISHRPITSMRAHTGQQDMDKGLLLAWATVDYGTVCSTCLHCNSWSAWWNTSYL